MNDFMEDFKDIENRLDKIKDKLEIEVIDLLIKANTLSNSVYTFHSGMGVYFFEKDGEKMEADKDGDFIYYGESSDYGEPDVYFEKHNKSFRGLINIIDKLVQDYKYYVSFIVDVSRLESYKLKIQNHT